MNFLLLFCLLVVVETTTAKPIEPIMVTDQTIQVNGEQRFFYAFEEGDEMVIDITIVKGKSIREFEILVYPESSKFSEFDISELKSKRLHVRDRGVYEFRIKSGGPKVVKLKIGRIPHNSARSAFDTNVQWRTVTDTIRKNYSETTTISYDTSFVTKQNKVLKKIDTTFLEVASQEERVHSRTNLTNDNVNTLTFSLPPPKIEAMSTEQVISWAYWVGVGQEGSDNYNEELKLFLQKAAFNVMSKNLLAGLALGIYSVSVNPPQGENIHYELNVINEKGKKQVAKGNVTSAFGRETQHLTGKIEAKLTNDNILNGLNVNLKLLAVIQRYQYKMETYQDRVITAIEVVDTKGRVIIREREIPVINAW